MVELFTVKYEFMRFERNSLMDIRIIDNKKDIMLKNEPFTIWGRMIPQYIDDKWSYTIEKYNPSEASEMCFPDENYDYDTMCENSFFVGAYEDEKCVGLAIFQKAFFKYLYLYDLKVSTECRRTGVAKKLIEKGKQIATEHGYRGIYTQGQDNNLSACLFYIHSGFRIGGLDTEVYKGTPQEGKKDIVFYLECEN